MAKTIKQIADEIGVSKQAIFYRIKKPPLSNTLSSLTSKENGVLMISFDGEMLIKEAFQDDTVKQIVKEASNKPSKENSSFDGEIISLLQKNIVVLQEQLVIKDKQIEELTATVKLQAESINSDRKNELASTLIDGQSKLLEDEKEKPETKKKFFNFFRKK